MVLDCRRLSLSQVADTIRCGYRTKWRRRLSPHRAKHLRSLAPISRAPLVCSVRRRTRPHVYPSPTATCGHSPPEWPARPHHHTTHSQLFKAAPPPPLTTIPTPGARARLGDQDEPRPKVGFWTKWKVDGSEARARAAKLGLAAVLAYGLFDAVTYTTFFVLAFLGYEKSTGKNPAANLKALLGIVILMWTGNNVTRPFRVYGAAALAPVMDRGLKGIQEKLNLRSQMYAFALVVGSVAAVCFTVVGILILSKWGK
ncbi:uncharacterized protein LOC133888577 [Phragmites australis]|uniref:uncharacterized protein LOC133888577 n=1 Tax=Phragmites australis TaxID=29695 RepID=UPI002D7913E0|nr:uncharacterized protein LOC133888577 [Phragmites australis]